MKRRAIVIGAGSAGCAAAFEASRLGFAVELIDSAPVPGGGSFGRGALPAAILRDCLRRYSSSPGADRPQRSSEALFREFVAVRGQVSRAHLAETRRNLESAGVRFVQGRARFSAPDAVSFDAGRTLHASVVVIATGSRPRRPPSMPIDGDIVCDEESIWSLDRLPRSLVIVGAEVVGCEFACLFAALGVQVTLIERRRRLIRCLDRDLLERLHGRLQELGIVVAIEEEIAAIDVVGGPPERHATLRLASGRVEKCDRVLVLAGRKAASAELGLEGVGIATATGGFPTVDESGQTSQPGVYAIGDVVGYPFRIGTGLHQARIAIRHAVGESPPLSDEPPITIHTLPAIGVVGMIEEAVRRLDLPYGVGRARLEATFAGQVERRAPGLLKLIFQREEGRLLGVEVMGEGATELIHIGAAWLQGGGTLDQIASSIPAQPSLAEAFRLAALDGLG